MKKIITSLSLFAACLAYSQGSTLIINNYSLAYDFHGNIQALNVAGGCYPIISSNNPDMVVVPADSNEINGLHLEYKNYRDQFGTSLYPMAAWNVSLSATNQTPRAWNHASLLPGGVISNNTKWVGSKFQMYHKGTNNPETFFNGNLGADVAPCITNESYITTPYGDAEWFTITSGGNNYTYIQIF